MSRFNEAVRPELIERLHKAARIERAETLRRIVRRIMRSLLQSEREGRAAGPTPIEPVIGSCR
jgi:hypothetical protein